MAPAATETLPKKSAKQLREERAPLAKLIRDHADKQHALIAAKKMPTAEDEQEWRKINADYDELTKQIQLVEAVEKLDSDDGNPNIRPGGEDYDGKKAAKRQAKEAKRTERQARLKAKNEARMGWLAPSITEEERCLALQGWCRRRMGLELKWQHRQACKRAGINPEREDLVLNVQPNYRKVMQMAYEHRALALNVNTAGGYTVPEGFVNNLEIALLAYAQVRQWARVLRTNSGQDLPWPTVNDTTNKGQILVENATVSPQDTTFGQIVFHAFKYTSNLVLVPVELMEDSAFDLAATLGNLLGIRIGRIHADHFTFGTGASQPTGYMTAATSFSAASPTAIGADDLYNLRHSVDPAYQGDPSVAWTMHDQILLAIKKLKDGAGRYLWQSSLAGGRPDTIDGIPLFINQSMNSTIASGKQTIAFGAWSKFVIRDVTQIRLRRLVERYADSDQQGFVMFQRADSNLVDAGTHPIKYLQH